MFIGKIIEQAHEETAIDCLEDSDFWQNETLRNGMLDTLIFQTIVSQGVAVL